MIIVFPIWWLLIDRTIVERVELPARAAPRVEYQPCNEAIVHPLRIRQWTGDG